jgi:hypothetical protein
MKKIGTAIFCLLSIFVIVFAGNAAAYNAAFEHILYAGDVPPTVDGTYGISDEWVVSGTQTFGTNGIFRDYWVMDPNLLCLLIETADNTNDAGDYWVVCWDSTDDGGATEPDGGPSPKTNDYKLVVTGHGASATVQWFKGTGTAWSTTPSTPAEGVLEEAQQLAPYTPKIGTPHYVLEMAISKMDTSMGAPLMGYTWATYIAYYDESTATLQSWPPAPASADVPDSWGYVTYDMGANPTPDVPEGITIGIMLSLSTLAVIVSTRYFRKLSKIKSHSPEKL